MGFRFRRSARLGPVRFNLTSKGLSSVSLGGRGASINIPVARQGGTRATVGIPGSGLSYTYEPQTSQRRIQRSSHPGSFCNTVLKPMAILTGGIIAIGVIVANLPGSTVFAPSDMEPDPAPVVSPVVSPSASEPEPEPAPAPEAPPAVEPADQNLYRGRRGGCFTYTGSGAKRYVDRSACDAAGI